MSKYNFSYIDELESEGIYVLREVSAQFENPALLFSGGKDSIVCLHLARKAFFPAKIPFRIVHIDTGHNFDEIIDFRDKTVRALGLDLVVGSVQDAIDAGTIQDELNRNTLQIPVLLDTIQSNSFDGCICGARRDEEKARAKERFFSHRDVFGQWDPKNQRPELWSMFNGRKKPDEHFRVFPISNWTELDVWEYIKREKIDIPSVYFSHSRKVYDIDDTTYAYDCRFAANRTPYIDTVRFRTVGDISCTGATKSDAKTIDDIISEVASSVITERGTRLDDKVSENSMEDRKIQGYY